MSTINTSKMITLFDYITNTVEDGVYSHNTHWLACKCPYCDSASNKRHMSIQLKEGEPIIYKCFRASCGVSGVLNKKIARDLGLTNPVFLKHIQESYNANIAIDNHKKNLVKKIQGISLGDISKECSDYFFKRTNTELTSELQDKFRIFSDINKFIEENSNIEKLRKKALWFIRKKEKEGMKAIYFLNGSNTMLYGREIDGDMKLKMSLVEREDPLETHRPYMFKSDGEDNYEGKEDTLFIGEGTFDIINAYLHIFTNYKGTFMASTSFTSTANLINLYSKYVFKPNIVILSDSDVDISVYTKRVLKRINKERVGDIYVLYNLEGKDLGDYPGHPYKIERVKIHNEKRGRRNNE